MKTLFAGLFFLKNWSFSSHLKLHNFKTTKPYIKNPSFHKTTNPELLFSKIATFHKPTILMIQIATKRKLPGLIHGGG